jgi:hypothetical protein
MKFNIGDIVEFNHLDEASRDYKIMSGLLLALEDNNLHTNYSVCTILTSGQKIKIPLCKLLSTKMPINKSEN